jgi:hypothetical protein
VTQIEKQKNPKKKKGSSKAETLETVGKANSLIVQFSQETTTAHIH